MSDMSPHALARFLGIGKHDDSHRFGPKQVFWLGVAALLGMPGSYITTYHGWVKSSVSFGFYLVTLGAFFSSIASVLAILGPLLDFAARRPIHKQAVLGCMLAFVGVLLTLACMLWLARGKDSL